MDENVKNKILKMETKNGIECGKSRDKIRNKLSQEINELEEQCAKILLPRCINFLKKQRMLRKRFEITRYYGREDKENDDNFQIIKRRKS